MRHETHDITGDDRLDDLLAQARWPEPTAESTERLRRGWVSLRKRPIANRFTWAAAAAVLIAIGAAAWFGARPERADPPAPAIARAPEVHVEAPIPMPPSTPVSRAPTPRERLALLSASPVPKSKPAAPAAAVPPPTRPRPAVESPQPRLHHQSAAALVTLARTAKSEPARAEAMAALLARGDAEGTEAFLSLVLDPTTRDAAMAALHGAPDSATTSLLAALDHNRVDYRLAAAKALGSMCDHGDVGARLQRMVRENDNRREALAALVSCRGKPAADFLRAARFRPAIDAEVRAVQNELANIFRT